MPQFLAVASRGLHQALLLEMEEKGFENLKKGPSGVLFEGSWKECYRANMVLKTTPRILKPILDFPAYNKDEFYDNAKKHDFTKYISPDQTLAVQSTIKDSNFKDQRYPSMLLKDVVVDQFQDKFNRRPSVDKDNPDLPLSVKIFKNQVSISLDTSGFSLSQRGYRSETIEAPLKEHVAAALIKLMKWTPEEAFYDPMCGSGTFVIEACSWNQAHLNSDFAFKRWKTFQPEVYQELEGQYQGLVTEVKRVNANTVVRSVVPPKNKIANTSLNSTNASQEDLTSGSTDELSKEKHFVVGSDISPKNLDVARIGIANAKLKNRPHLFQVDIFNLTEKILHAQVKDWPQQGLILMNPPYDLRLKTRSTLTELYDQLLNQCYLNLPGWRIGLLAPSEFEERSLMTIPDSVANFESGGLKIKLLRFRPKTKI